MVNICVPVDALKLVGGILMVDDVFNTLFSDLISSCVLLEGVVYVPVESFLSSTGACLLSMYFSGLLLLLLPGNS